MQRSDFNYSLPEELIAKRPARERGASRLLCLDGNSGVISETVFNKLPDILQAGDLLVLNDTRVLPARLFARKPTGGRVELMLERVIDEQIMKVQLRTSKTPEPGSTLLVNDNIELTVVERDEELFILSLSNVDITIDGLLNEYGHMPLPPYIDREDEDSDRTRYQTVYASQPGAVAAPTAGLHFTDRLLEELQGKNINHVFVTLHIGAGTFQPVRVNNIAQHKMHSERVSVSDDLVEKIRKTKDNGGRIVAVGTTTVRSLETAALYGQLNSLQGETNIFIYPGFEFRVIDVLITNFHLPESTLLMLVCAFGGTVHVLNAYQYAIDHQFRFYSYGDAMLITTPQVSHAV